MGYIQAQEDALLRLIDKTTPYEYKWVIMREPSFKPSSYFFKKIYLFRPPQPQPWDTLGSEKEVEGSWVRDSRPKVQS